MNKKELRDKLVENILNANKLRQEYQTEIEAIENDRKYSAEYKRQLKKERHAELMTALDKLSEDAENGTDALLKRWVDSEGAKVQPIDYSSPHFMSAVNAIKTLGRDMPESVALSICNDFKNSLEGREALRSIASANHCDFLYGELQKIGKSAEGVASRMSDAMYYGARQLEMQDPADVDAVLNSYTDVVE